MQHYGIPTRLLDFTYSPYVALYFAIQGKEANSTQVAVWAINAELIHQWGLHRARLTSMKVEEQTAKREGREIKPRRISLSPDSLVTDADELDRETREHSVAVNTALRATGTRRNEFNRHGCVMFSIPPVQNRRLSSQQGAFLFNFAKELNFETSLLKMTEGKKDEWCKLFHIPIDSVDNMERRLFQMNIRGLSLFPDMDGLASFVRQKMRLHWAP